MKCSGRWFKLACFGLCVDKFGFELLSSLQSALLCVKSCHFWLGIQFDDAKVQVGQQVTILGVHYDLERFVLRVTEKRKQELLQLLRRILEDDWLTPGEAGHLRGKLLFAASQLWGRTGRAFLRALSERQYWRAGSGTNFSLSVALPAALTQWVQLVMHGRPRCMPRIDEATVEVALFRDGFYPHLLRGEIGEPGVGGVLFVAGSSTVHFFSEVVAREVLDAWMPRKNQICMVELYAVVMALLSFDTLLCGKRVILMVDSEAVEAALVKGYSRKEDVCSLVSVFWLLAEKLGCALYIDRVSTDANIADTPSRGNLLVAQRNSWVRVTGMCSHGPG